MKKIIIGILAAVSMTNGYTQESPSFRVLERKAKSNKTTYQKVNLEDLQSADAFDGKYFKIVKGKSDEAIRFNDQDTLLVSKAANVYYHLTKARNYWFDVMRTRAPENLAKVVVRLEMKNVFDSQGHFAHDNRDPQFNNALSIPSGQTPNWVPADRQRKWEKEIWFRPMKKIETKDLPGMGPNPLTTSLQVLEEPFINYTTNRFSQSIIEHIFYPSYAANPLWVDVIRFAGTIALTKAVIEASKHTDRLFADKYYYLDTAMVPEVIYHEYAHLILSDHLELSHSTPVIEGMADYFAASLADKRRVYAPVKGYSNAAIKDTDSKKKYTHWYESNRFATSDFTLSVLWDVRDVLGEEIGNEVVYEARTFLRTSSATVNHHLIQAVLDACQRKCRAPRVDKLKLYEAFAAKGF